eukprot:6195101-Amphidinium_carterae.3
MYRLWLPGLVFILCGLMVLGDTVAILTSGVVGLATTLTLEKVALEECKPKRLVSDCKGVVSCLHALTAGRRQPKGRHRDLESRALDALPAVVQIVWMKAHQTDRDAEAGRVGRSDLHGNHQADLAANKGTSEHVRPRSGSKLRSTVCQAVRNFWLLVSPTLRNRPEQWPTVRLPAPEPEPEVVEFERPVRFPAEPLVCGHYLHVVEHETNAICLDCQRHVGVHTGRGGLNFHVLKGRPCKPS